MKKQFLGTYPENQKEINTEVKEAAGWVCERCKHPNDRASGHVLTVHHLDGNKANWQRWNLAALCQRCHLHIQARVFMPQFYMLEHSEWFLPHVIGYYRSVGLDFNAVVSSERGVLSCLLSPRTDVDNVATCSTDNAPDGLPGGGG